MLRRGAEERKKKERVPRLTRKGVGEGCLAKRNLAF